MSGTVPVVADKAAITAQCLRWKKEGRSIGLVPTMGALHDGHLSLARAARAENDAVVVSIFVNPLQFGRGEDLARYPRDLDGDCRKLATAGVDAVFTTTPDAMYPPGFATYVVDEALSTRLEGEVRPGHFRGVLTVVAKLFHLVPADVAYFGQKDAQQAALIRRMARDLDFPVAVKVLPTVREPDGLAMSSRNAYLGAEARKRATALVHGLRAAEALFTRGERSAATLIAAARDTLLREAPGIAIDYIALVDPNPIGSFDAVDPSGRAGARALLLIAARPEGPGGTRLLDNVLLGGGSL